MRLEPQQGDVIPGIGCALGLYHPRGLLPRQSGDRVRSQRMVERDEQRRTTAPGGYNRSRRPQDTRPFAPNARSPRHHARCFAREHTQMKTWMSFFCYGAKMSLSSHYFH